MKKPCTLWYRLKDDLYLFNHLEDGHAQCDKPAPKFPSQEGWRRATWRREWRRMVGEPTPVVQPVE